jgi:hypothetical protein
MYEIDLQLHLLPASKQTTVPVWQMPVAVCTFSISWWMERPSEACRFIRKWNKFDTSVYLFVSTIKIILRDCFLPSARNKRSHIGTSGQKSIWTTLRKWYEMLASGSERHHPQETWQRTLAIPNCCLLFYADGESIRTVQSCPAI